MERVVQVLLALLVLLDQVHEVAVLERARRTRVVHAVVLKAAVTTQHNTLALRQNGYDKTNNSLGMKRMIAQAVNGRKVELLATVLALVGLENDGICLEVVDLALELHDALKIAVDRLRVLVDLLLLFAHPFEQIVLWRVEYLSKYQL